MFVGELHGYNLEGQLEIEALNKAGKLDTQVRRVEAAEEFKRAAKLGTYGVLKMLTSSKGDGRMDTVRVWATDLPPVYGIIPARGGQKRAAIERELIRDQATGIAAQPIFSGDAESASRDGRHPGVGVRAGEIQGARAPRGIHIQATGAGEHAGPREIAAVGIEGEVAASGGEAHRP